MRFKSENFLSHLYRAFRAAKYIGLAVWEIICWLIIPVVFGYLCYGSIAKKFDLSLMQVCLAIIALSPWILRILSLYLSEFNFGLKGVSGKLKGVRNRDEIDKPISVANENGGVEAQSEFAKFLPQARKVLRTLWRYQVELFGADDIRRWGFRAALKSPEFMQFSIGVGQLLKRNLVALDSFGLVFLTAEGVNFCKKENVEIVGYPEQYTYFTAVP